MWNSNIENTELDFIYSDTDSHANEMAELYSYTEEQDILNNKNDFEEIMLDHGFPLKWNDMPDTRQKRVIELLMDRMELTQESSRWKAIHALLYLLQGNFGECDTIGDNFVYSRKNAFELYRLGLFPICVQLLQWEIENGGSSAPPINAQKKVMSTITSADSKNLRTILSILYSFVEIIRTEREDDTPEEVRLRQQLREELSQSSEPLLAITLFQMTTKFCNGSSPQFPIRKVLLLLWKVLLFSLGGVNVLRQLKDDYRAEAQLKPVPDDTLEVVKTMRPASPPINANEVMYAQNQRKLNRPFRRQMIVKQSSIGGEENETVDVNEDDLLSDESGVGSDSDSASGGNGDGNGGPKTSDMDDEEKIDMGGSPASPRPGTPNPGSLNRSKDEPTEENPITLNRGLPWLPKVRHRDMDAFFDSTRSKFIGFILPQDRTTTAGLPDPILEGIKILQNHLYVSLNEVQVKREEDLLKYPLTFGEGHLKSLNSPAEGLYAAMLPSLSQYMIALLKILLAAAPTSRAKTESINIISDVLPKEIPESILLSMKLGIDVNRHKEIIIKSVSAILFLVLKHYKVNHVYQFEYISQQLMFANCIPARPQVLQSEHVSICLVAKFNLSHRFPGLLYRRTA